MTLKKTIKFQEKRSLNIYQTTKINRINSSTFSGLKCFILSMNKPKRKINQCFKVMVICSVKRIRRFRRLTFWTTSISKHTFGLQ
jgi:hypothetical protein